MSPFANYLRELRRSRNLKQKDVAELLGYEQSYLSSLESGAKGLPRRAFIDRLISKLSLDAEEQRELERVMLLSDRRILLPTNASPEEYEIWHSLKALTGRLGPGQLGFIKNVLDFLVPAEGTNITGSGRHGADRAERGRTM